MPSLHLTVSHPTSVGGLSPVTTHKLLLLGSSHYIDGNLSSAGSGLDLGASALTAGVSGSSITSGVSIGGIEGTEATTGTWSR